MIDQGRRKAAGAISPSVTAYVKIPSEAFVGLLLNSGDRNNGNVFLTYGLCCLPYIEGIRPRIDAHAIYAPLPDQHMEDTSHCPKSNW